MVDLHCHILPGLDDGAQTPEEAVAMAQIAAKSDLRHITATSHGNFYPYTPEEYDHAFQMLRDELRRLEIPVKLFRGMEIFVDGEAASLLRKGWLLPLNDTNYILIEFPFEEDPGLVIRRVGELQAMGYRIVLAHPERYIFLQKDVDLAWYLADRGCVYQVNQGSLVGDFGNDCERLAKFLLREHIAGVIATDAHDTEYRSHDLGRSLAWLKANYSAEQIHLWLSENPSRILKGMDTVPV